MSMTLSGDGSITGLVAGSSTFTSGDIGGGVRSTTQCGVTNVDSRNYSKQDSASIYFAIFR